MKPKVRVLIVTDDGLANGGFLEWISQSMPEAVGTNSREFHLGEFIKVLTNTAWIGFQLEITKAHRSPAGTGGMNEAALKADRGADVINFRFNQSFVVNGETRTLANYDMILFFPIKYGNADPTLNAEAEAIAQFMENGGGFFATGDHANLGSPLCAQIPRVRSMRRWYFDGSLSSESPPGPAGEPPAPPPLGMYRIDTTRRGLDGIGQFEDQSDEIPQEIIPTYYGAGLTVKMGYPAHKYLPHPILCSPDGVIKYLPDHMHEGICEIPENLSSRTFTIGGSTVREYPDYLPPSPPPGYVASALSPEIVALGEVLPGTITPALDTDAHVGSPDAAQTRTFGVIGAWDGHRVSGKGRVIVDSTWHHFFNINLTGDRYLEDESLSTAHQQKLHGFYIPDGMGSRKPNDEYKMIMWYFRNIVYWLIPAHRLQTIWWVAVADMFRRPQLREELGSLAKIGEFKNFNFEHYYYFGQLAEAYFAKARGACAYFIIHEILYIPKIPWWEWIQEQADVWAPIINKNKQQEIAQQRLLGALGVGPKIDMGMTITLGAVVLTYHMSTQELGKETNTTRLAEYAQELLPKTLEHMLDQYDKVLRMGEESHAKLQKLIHLQKKRKAEYSEN